MFLARREYGKFARVYPLKTDRPPCAWPFFCDRTDEIGFKVFTKAAVRAGAVGGVCAVHHTRAAALDLLELAEAGMIEEFTEVQQ